MCRLPENCGRHMECACYFADTVNAIGLVPAIVSGGATFFSPVRSL